MLQKLLKRIGYGGIEDAVDFLMCGLATLPALLMLSGFMLAGAAAMTVLLLLVAVVGMQAPPPEPPSESDLKKSGKRPQD